MLNLSVTMINSSSPSDNGYDLFLIDCSSNDVTLSLVEPHLDKVYYFRRLDNNALNTCTIVSSNGMLIDGNSSVNINVGTTFKIVYYIDTWHSFT